MELKQIVVTFPTGKDVLNAYWGFLSHGGLVLRDGEGLAEGDSVALEVTIESSKRHYRLNGQVVRRPELRSEARGRTVIAFHPGEPHDLLLSAAWAETDNVPARRHPRFPIDASIRFRDATGAEQARDGRLLNLSYGGCCLREDRRRSKRLEVGAKIALLGADVEVPGVVKWSRGADVGIEFEERTVSPADVDRFVRGFL